MGTQTHSQSMFWQTKNSQFQPFASQLAAMVSLDSIGFFFEEIETTDVSPQAQAQRLQNPAERIGDWLLSLDEDEPPTHEVDFEIATTVGFTPPLPYPSLGFLGGCSAL